MYFHERPAVKISLNKTCYNHQYFANLSLQLVNQPKQFIKIMKKINPHTQDKLRAWTNEYLTPVRSELQRIVNTCDLLGKELVLSKNFC